MPILLAALCCSSLGVGATVMLERLAQERGPAGWELTAPPIPSLATWVDAPVSLPGTGWPLDGHHRLIAPGPGREIAVDANLAPESRLTLALPVGNGEEEAQLHLEPAGVPTLLLSRGDGARRGNPIQCDAGLPKLASHHIVARLEHNEESLLVTVNGSQVRCQSPSPSQGMLARPSIAAGLQRAALTAVATDQGQANAPGPAWLFRILFGVLGAGLGGWILTRSMERPARSLAPMLPFFACLPLACSDLEGWFHGARIHIESPLLSAVVLPGLASGLCLGFSSQVAWIKSSSADLSLRAQAARTGIVSGLLAILLSLIFGPEKFWAYPLIGLAGSSLGILVWVNVRAASLPRFNWLSLLCVGLAVSATEAALRGTASGRSWAGMASAGLALESEATLEAGFVALESTRTWSEYPDQGYPVAPPERGDQLRVVVFGGSSTGGAFDTDDLSRFYPARIQAHLEERIQVVNQGVGGWTTLHIRRHVEARAEELRPSIAVLYVGHNDLLTRSRRPYSQLLEAWQDDMRLSGVLGRSWIYRGLRFSLEASLGRRDGSAVPMQDARENVASIVSNLVSSGARVLLVREVVVPSTPDLEGYAAMLKSAASSSESVAWLDPTDTLLDPAQGQVFVDDVHLTGRGHDLLAQLMVSRLSELQWLNTPVDVPTAPLEGADPPEQAQIEDMRP